MSLNASTQATRGMRWQLSLRCWNCWTMNLTSEHLGFVVHIIVLCLSTQGLSILSAKDVAMG